MPTYDPHLRKLGYRVRTGPASPVIGMLERAGARPRPLNRAYPADGHWIGRCPFCEAEDRLFVEPGLSEWSTTCGCSPGGGLVELHAALILSAMAA